MDRTVTVRFYSVEHTEDHAPLFADAMRAVAQMPLADREHEPIPDIVIRLEQLAENRGLISGELIRRQTEHLPPRASAGQPVQPLGVDSIGHSTAFVYSPALSVLAFQIARNGITAGRLGMYLSSIRQIPQYAILPVPTMEMWQRLRHDRIRAVRVRVAVPDDLAAVEPEQVSMKRGFREMQQAAQTTYVDVSLGMTRGDDDMDRRRASRLLNWLRSQRENERGGITKIKAAVVSGDDHTEWLDLIKGQLGGTRKLDLPDDDPGASYQIRDRYLNQVFGENQAALREMFRVA